MLKNCSNNSRAKRNMAIFEVRNPDLESDFWGINGKYHESRKMLEEECHAFEEQYKWARGVAKQCIISLRNRVYSFKAKHQYSIFSNIDVTITLGEYDFLCQANIYRINTDSGTIYVNVFYNRDLVKRYPDYKIEDETYRIVAHEMMHGNIFANRIRSSDAEDDKIDDTPNYYQNLVWVMRNYPAGSDEYLFARALYLYYYQETQAIVSQGFAELDNELKSLNKATVKNSEIKYLIWKTESYKDFADSKMICNKVIKYPTITNKIQRMLSESGIDIPSKQFLYFVKKVRKKLARGLRDIISNMYYYCWKNYRIVG